MLRRNKRHIPPKGIEAFDFSGRLTIDLSTGRRTPAPQNGQREGTQN